MIRIPVFEYVCRTSRGIVRVPTFNPRDGTNRLVGHVVAPDGAELIHKGQGALTLKVPKPGRPGEFWAMTAEDAQNAAIATADGLSWDFSGVWEDAVVK